MQVTVTTVLLKISAGGDDLGIDQVGVFFAFHLAQIWRFPVPEQRFEQGVVFLAADVDLDVAATGRPPGMVGGATVGGGTGVGVGSERQRPSHGSGVGQAQVHLAPPLHHPEMIAAESPRLALAARSTDCPAEAMGLAADRARAIGGVQVPTGDVDPDLAPELVVRDKGAAEVDPLGMAHQPGRIVVFRPLHGTDPNGEGEGAALGANCGAWGSCHGDPNVLW